MNATSTRGLSITQFVNTLSTEDGGPARNSYETNQALNRRADCTATLVSWNGRHDSTVADRASEDASAHRGPIPVWLRAGRSLNDLKIVVRQIQNSDVVIIHGYYLPWVPVVASIARVQRKPLVVMPHGALTLYDLRKSRIKKKLFNTASRLLVDGPGTVFATGSSSERRELLYNRPSSKVSIVGAGTRVPPMRTVTQREEVRLLALSRIAPKKRHDLMIRCLAEGIQGGRLVHLDIAGTGDPALIAQLRALSEKLGVADHVHFLGHLDGDAKSEAFYRATTFLMPSDDENFGLTFAEALAHGLPVICSANVAAAEEAIAPGVTVLPEPSPQALWTAVRSLTNADRLSAARTSAREQAVTMFDWDRVGERWHALLASIVKVNREQ